MAKAEALLDEKKQPKGIKYLLNHKRQNGKEHLRMEISRITEQNYNAFQRVLPSCRHPLPPHLFGCVAEGVAIGSAMLELTAEEINAEAFSKLYALASSFSILAS